MEVGERLTVIQQHKKEDVVENEMVDQPPLMEPEEGKREEIEQAASESRHLADELAGMLDRLEIEEERSADVNAVVLGEQEEVSCVGIRQKRPSVIVAARSRKRAIEDETNNKDAAEELSDADVNAVVLGEQEVVGQASLDEARISWIFGYLDDGYLDIWKMKQDKEKETTAHGHVATLSTEERVRGIKKEITLAGN